MKGKYLLAFWIGNGLLAVFFYGTWLLSWWIPAIEHLQGDITDSQLMASWFISFFTASFIPLRLAHNKFPVLKSIGFASLFWLFLFCLMVISISVLDLPLD